MAMACKAVSSLDLSSPSSSHDKASQCKLSISPFSRLVAPSLRPFRRRQKSVAFASTAGETQVSQSRNAVGSFEDPSLSLQTRQNASQGTIEADRDGLPSPEETMGNGSSSQTPFIPQVLALEPKSGSASPLVQVPDARAQGSIQESEQAGVRLRDDDDEEDEQMEGFHGAKGALIKPMSADSLAYFPDGYLDTVSSIRRLDWVTLVPTAMLPKGDRLVLDHNSENVILVWFEDRIYALENRSPADPGHEEGFSRAVISEDGLITCPGTGSKFDIRTGEAVEWFPNISFLERLLTPVLNDLSIYAVKASPKHIFINRERLLVGGLYPFGEFAGKKIWTGPDYEEPIIFDDLEFGFTEDNELTNGRLAMVGFLGLLLFEMTTGEGILKAFGALDLLYEYLPGFPVLRY